MLRFDDISAYVIRCCGLNIFSISNEEAGEVPISIKWLGNCLLVTPVKRVLAEATPSRDCVDRENWGKSATIGG